MTQAEWLASTDPTPMLGWLRGRARSHQSNRKLRLFASACCRRIWPLLTDERSRRGVEVGERYVDGLASQEECDLAARESHAAAAALCKIESARSADGGVCSWLGDNSAWYAASAASKVPDYGRFRGPADAAENAVYVAANRKAEESVQATLLRDVIGNPFRPSPHLPPAVLAWNDSTVRRIAEGIYEERQLPAGTLSAARLAILADALLDAGCEDEDLIAHCRGDGPHVRGCWAVDLILGKS
jgi:hypothetical protein